MTSLVQRRSINPRLVRLRECDGRVFGLIDGMRARVLGTKFKGKGAPNPMVPSLPKIGYSAIEGGGEGATDGISLSPVSSSSAGVRQP